MLLVTKAHTLDSILFGPLFLPHSEHKGASTFAMSKMLPCVVAVEMSIGSDFLVGLLIGL